MPAFSHEAMTHLARGPLPWLWQRDAVHALRRFVKRDTSKAVRAGWTLAEDVWRLLYRSADSPGAASSGRQQMPGPTKAPLRLGGGPPGACFRCGLYGHWARDCDRSVTAFGPHPSQASLQPAVELSQPTQRRTQLSQQVFVKVPAPGRKGGFTQVGAQTLYTAYSTGKTYISALRYWGPSWSIPSCRHGPPIVPAICTSQGRSTTSPAAVAKSVSRTTPMPCESSSQTAPRARVPTLLRHTGMCRQPLSRP